MNPRETIVLLDRQYVWHPYTPMGEYRESDPLVVSRAEGVRFYDADGRSYLDANSSWWCAVLGHGHPRLVAALAEQAARLAHVPLAGIAHEPAAELARELALRAPAGLGHAFFSDDGSTAVEAALKLCLQYWHQNGRPQRTRFVALDGAFHGETLGATALGGVDVFRRPFASVLLDCLRVPTHARGFEQAFDALSELLQRDGDSIAAVVLEPIVQGAAGMRFYDPELLRAARELTRSHDVFLVADEVFSGYGRTGPFWASEHAAVLPDVLCTAKGLSGGLLPFAATLASERLFEGFLGGRERMFFYGHTFAGNPLGARVALEVLRIYDEERVLERARPKAARIARAFEGMAELPGVAATRALGMIGALDLEGERGYLAERGRAVCDEARRRGVYLRPLGNTIYVAPALNIPDAELDLLLELVADTLRAVERSAEGGRRDHGATRA